MQHDEYCSVFNHSHFFASFFTFVFPSVLFHVLLVKVILNSNSHSVDNFLVIPNLYLATQKSVQQFGYIFSFNATTVQNSLSDEI